MNDTDETPTANQVVGYNMGYFRKAAGMTQAQLGGKLGWSHTTVSAAEKSWDGKRVREFNADQIIAIATELGIPLTGLFMPPDDGGRSRLGALFSRVVPSYAGRTPVMMAYRRRLIAAAGQYLKPGEGHAFDMAGQADALMEQREADERGYRRRMRAYLTEQLAALGPAEDEAEQ